jgi:hypothetical protein
MATSDKKPWTPPAVRPVTDRGSRADDRDVQLQNIIIASGTS